MIELGNVIRGRYHKAYLLLFINVSSMFICNPRLNRETIQSAMGTISSESANQTGRITLSVVMGASTLRSNTHTNHTI